MIALLRAYVADGGSTPERGALLEALLGLDGQGGLFHHEALSSNLGWITIILRDGASQAVFSWPPFNSLQF